MIRLDTALRQLTERIRAVKMAECDRTARNHAFGNVQRRHHLGVPVQHAGSTPDVASAHAKLGSGDRHIVNDDRGVGEGDVIHRCRGHSGGYENDGRRAVKGMQIGVSDRLCHMRFPRRQHVLVADDGQMQGVVHRTANGGGIRGSQNFLKLVVRDAFSVKITDRPSAVKGLQSVHDHSPYGI